MAELLKSNVRIKALNLSGNRQMSDVTAVAIADALQAHETPYPMHHIEMADIRLRELGMRYRGCVRRSRLCELLTNNSAIKLAIVGKLCDKGLRLLGDFVDSFVGLESLQFEECVESRWSKEAMDRFVAGLKRSETLLDVKVSTVDRSQPFARDVAFHTAINRQRMQMKRHLDEWAGGQSVDKEFDCLM